MYTCMYVYARFIRLFRFASINIFAYTLSAYSDGAFDSKFQTETPHMSRSMYYIIRRMQFGYSKYEKYVSTTKILFFPRTTDLDGLIHIYLDEKYIYNIILYIVDMVLRASLFVRGPEGSVFI